LHLLFPLFLKVTIQKTNSDICNILILVVIRRTFKVCDLINLFLTFPENSEKERERERERERGERRRGREKILCYRSTELKATKEFISLPHIFRQA
jgi:hypothetical protein